jgi:hypothetical protein
MFGGCDSEASLSTTQEQEEVLQRCLREEEKHPRGRIRVATTLRLLVEA